VKDTVRQKHLKEIPEPDRMTTHNHILFLHRRRIDKLTKVLHPFQSVRLDGLVTSVQTHVRLTIENVLKVAQLGGLLNPRGLDGRVRRGNGERIRVAANLLQGLYHQDLVIRSSSQPITKATSQGRSSAAKTGAENLGFRSTRLGTEDFEVLCFGAVQVGASNKV